MINREALLYASSFLSRYTDTPEMEAELLLSHILNCSSERLITSLGEEFPAQSKILLDELLHQRAQEMPLSLIRGRKNFCGFSFLVAQGIFIPRFDSEILIYALLEKKSQGNRILDLCAGTGALGLSAFLLGNFREVVLTDISEKALQLAKRNAARLGVASARFLRGDLWNPLDADPLRFDAILCNPPYIPSEECESLPLSVRKYEPRRALDGGKGGLEIHARIAERIVEFLQPGGWAVVEVAPFQEEKVSRMWLESGMKNVDAVFGIDGEPRGVIGQCGL